MLSQRTLTIAARRLASQRPSSIVTRFASPVAIATNTHIIQRRQVTSNPVTESTADAILSKQRRARPVAPHLAIYKWQVTWIPSALNRVTGVALSGIFYLYGIAYLVAPALGLHLESAVLAASVAAWPIAAKILMKSLLALPFTFHSLNGFRHLSWDLGKLFGKQTVIKTGWTAIGLSVVSALYLTFAY